MKTNFLNRLNLIAILSLLMWLAGTPHATAQRFLLVSSNGVAANSMAVVAADVNGDGKVDLISADYGGNTLTVLTNRGSGTFTASSTNVVGTAPRSVVAVDVNGDGWLDLASANDGDNTLTVLTNNGKGTFTFSATLTVGIRPGAIAAADVNGDGKADLICANFNDNTLTVLTNNGNGTFTFSATLPVGYSPWSIAAADVNGDGKVDLISANYIGGNLTVLTNDGNGTFTQSATLGGGGMSVAAADVNGDGKVDLISADFNGNSLTVLTNDGTGMFTFAATLPAGPNPSSVAVADVNGDGRLDLISANSWGSTLSVLINIGNGAFTFSTPPTVGSGPQCIIAADVNGDGRVDLISSVGNALVVLLSLPASAAATPPAYDYTISALAPGLRDPRGMAVDRSGNLYVADTGNNRVVKFTGKGQFLIAWGGAGNADGQFSSPVGIALDTNNNVYVADSGNNRIQKFTSTGAYVTQWACSAPSGVAVDSQNRVYVAAGGIEWQYFSPWTGVLLTDYVSGVWKFTSNGAVLQQWIIDTTPFAEAAYWGSGGWGVRGLAVDRSDNVYVGFTYYYRDPTGGGGWTRSWSGAGIEKFTANGAYISAVGNPVPDGMAVDGANNLYVADPLNNRLNKFSSSGTLLTQWGIAGGALGQLSGPRGMAMDRSGIFLYVADSGNNRILVFAFRPTLNIQPAGANTAIASWSTAAIGFKLQTTTNLTPPVTWIDVTNSPALIGGQFTITNAVPDSTQIFRLVKP